MPGRPRLTIVLNACREAELPAPLAHTLLVLASYYPNIRPGQARLASDMGIKKRAVNYRLGALEELGLIARDSGWAGRNTRYTLNLDAIRALQGAPDCTKVVQPDAHEDQQEGTAPDQADPLKGW